MSETTYQLIAIGVYFAAMLAIGYYAYTRTRNIDGCLLYTSDAADDTR